MASLKLGAGNGACGGWSLGLLKEVSNGGPRSRGPWGERVSLLPDAGHM